MRIALITLAITALVFIGSIVYALLGKGGLSLPTKTTQTTTTDTPLEIEALKQQIRLDAKIDELTKKIDALSKNTNTTSSEVNNSTASSSSSATSNAPTVTPLSGKFLIKVMPALDLTLEKNSGIFDLHVFDQGTQYSTYVDPKLGMKAIATSLRYDTFIKNIQALGKEVYTINETKTFPFRAFYVNLPKPDHIVRLVVEFETQCIAIEVPKEKFGTLRDLLLGKAITPVTTPIKPLSTVTSTVRQTSTGGTIVSIKKLK